MTSQIADFCEPAAEMGLRMFAFQFTEGYDELVFQQFLTYDQHIAAIAMIEFGYDRHSSMSMAYDGHVYATSGRGILIGFDDTQIGTLQTGTTTWAVWQRHLVSVPVGETNLAFSAVRYTPGRGVHPF
ncbi:hypothetical protein [Novosphingobium mangrovi (ex Hu et al. 2023)]|uniref:Uncharacterized protein n=1 Tax=Novosphingobium mangrovi (ex Hu et al. 2023) TaxID=2930094 RepID=A0ABT0AGY8_9SPHN|nr:hypothetical protein [Novosphingobium mangrovi (ex Hu et al. 2023)]MCJ1962445.1 hypothetical protein [Novosphingobium mangrovi (ex Hu et al. 2023)]